MRKPAGQIQWHEALARVREFLSEQEADLSDHRFLLAVSGGMDSMCMLELLYTLDASIDVAHLNYQLRGRDSELDAQLVRDTCRSRALTYYEKTVDLQSILNQSPDNLQLKARALRYAWFEELMVSEGYHFVLTAHHQDDAVETFFINLLRGTGLKGLTGIPGKRDRYLRPMLCFTRREIATLVGEKEIAYREDATNETLDYLRNRVRHTILPALMSETEHLMSRMYKTQARLREEYALLKSHLDDLRHQLMQTEKNRFTINRDALTHSPAPSVVLFELIREFGFSYHQCRSAALHEASAGVHFLSAQYQMQLDRNAIYIIPLAGADPGNETIVLQAPGTYVLPEGRLSIAITSDPAFTEDRCIEFADGRILEQKLTLRKWQAGDVFYPLGLGGKQKLQDYYTNEKFSPQDKAGTWILTANAEVVWVVGRRLDDRFKVGENTGAVVRLDWTPEEP